MGYNMVRRSRRPARRARRRVARRGRARRGLNASVPRRSLQFKSYSYQFKLTPQILLPSTVNPGVWLMSAVTGAGAGPLQNNEVFTTSATTGFAGYNDIGLATSFALNDLSQVAAFTQVYDAYKINKVTCNIEFLNNSATVGVGVMPTVWMYYDADDSAVPQNNTRLVGKQGVRRHHFGSDRKNSFSFSFTPTVQTLTSNTGGAQATAIAAKPTWLNCSYTTVPHQALKMWIADARGNTTADSNEFCAFRLNWTYHVSFRSPINVF